MKRKHPTIDILKFYAACDNKVWNKFLYRCVLKKDIRKLTQMQYGFQAGMKDLTDKKLNSDKIVNFFIRIQRSIENTMKEIWRQENDNPLYSPGNSDLRSEYIVDKREKDHNFELFLKDSRF